jgi:hypothetical protein
MKVAVRKNPAAVELGRRGGKAKSAAKSKAVVENGHLGGRPRLELPCIKCGTKTKDRDASRRADCGCAVKK